MKKTLAVLAILIMAFSFSAIAQDEGGTPPPSEPETPPSEPTPPPAEEPAPLIPPSIEGPVAPPGGQMPPQTGEQPVPPPVPGGQGEPGSGGQPSQPNMCYFDGREVPCDQMPRPDDRPPQTGPGSGGCWVGEQQVPCPGEGPRLPQGCREIIEPNGMRRVDCAGQQREPGQMSCTSGPDRERIEKECAAKGGRTIVKNVDPTKGCGIVDCVFGQGTGNFMPGQQQTCPGPDELKQKEESCRSMGLNAKRMRSNCEYVQCEDPNKRMMECPDNHDEWERVSHACTGRVVKAFDANGCNIPQCVGEGEDCPRDVPQEAYFKCEDQGGKLVVNTDENGCISFSKCVKRGEEGVEAEEIGEVPPAAKLLQVALNLESVKISFDKLAKQIEAIADYYEGEDDMANAERFRRAAGMFESAKSQIDGVKEELKMAARGMSKEQLMNIKHKLRQITDVVMEDALYVILGGEDVMPEAGYEYELKPVEKEEEFTGYVPKNEKDCGNDGMCFERGFRICEKAVTVNPERNVQLKIVGIEEGACIIKVSSSTPAGEADMTCKFTDYATMPMTKESFMSSCEGQMTDFMKQAAPGREGPPMEAGGEMMGCEKVAKGINPKDVCGNECCENGESYKQCPSDCMEPGKVYEGQMMGCAQVEKGLAKQGICGNGCCEERFGESYNQCPRDCMASGRIEQASMMQRVEETFRERPMFEPPREPMYDEGRFFDEARGPMQPGEQMPEVQPVEPERPVEEMPSQELVEEQVPVAETQVAESSGGGMGATAAVIIDAIKEMMGGR